MSKLQAWSHSALDDFILCPKKYYHTKIAKDVKVDFGSAAEYGKAVHKHFEEYVAHGKALPLDLKHWEKILDKFVNADGKIMTEQQLAVTKDLEPTGWFDDDVWCRAIIDLVVVRGKKAVIVDYKTGRFSDGFKQLELAFALLTKFIDIDEAVLTYVWTKNKRITKKRITVDDLPEFWEDILKDVNALQECVNKQEFGAKPNFLCKKHCPVKNCVYNGV